MTSTTRRELFGSTDVVVLGGGIVGLTTAIALQSLGLSVTIVAEKLPNAAIPNRQLGLNGPPDPHVATSYAMASAYPHNLRVKNLERISDDSQSVFNVLNSDPNSGVEIQELYEVFEDEPAEPALGSRRMKMEYFDGTPAALKNTIDPPARPGAAYLWGWKFDTYFADMPKYLSHLWSLFKERGGILERQRVPDTLLQGASGHVLVNCLGIGAIEFAKDSTEAKILRGKQILVPDAPRIIGKHALPLAYNYTPKEEVFPRGDGNPEYVHFFSREDGWLLGQTREPGTLDESGQWQGIVSPVATENFDGVDIPHLFFDLNRALLSSWLDVQIPDTKLIARQGYRYYRDPLDTGVRLESEEKSGAFMVHNYGHGGSGITMSWGCAIEAARLVSPHMKSRNFYGNNSLDRVLQSSVSCTR